MKLTVLGCHGPYPAAGGSCSGYLLEEGDTRVLIDCGNGVLSRLQYYYKPWELDAVIVSHLHADHISDLFVLRYALDQAIRAGLRSSPLPLYAPPDPAGDYERLAYKDVYRVIPLHVGKQLLVGPFSFQFQETAHAIFCLAMRITAGGRVLVYSGDTEPFPGLAGFARQAALFLCEANFQEADMREKPPNHLSASQAAMLAAEAGVQKLLLTHLPPERDPAVSEREAREFFPAAEAVYSGLTCSL